MTGIVEFLRARYAEEKEAAEDASISDARGPHWSVAERPPPRWGIEPPDDAILAGGRAIIRFDSEYGGSLAVDHVVLHDPARVLADIDAKLQIVDLYTHVRYNDDGEPYFCGSGEEIWYESLCLLALPFAGHDDYDQRWKP